MVRLHHLPELKASELVRGVGYHAVFYHREGCRLYAGGRCSCRPDVRYFAEPVRLGKLLCERQGFHQLA